MLVHVYHSTESFLFMTTSHLVNQHQ